MRQKLLLFVITLTVVTPIAAQEVFPGRSFQYAPTPVDNPLKGFFPFRGEYKGTFPYSMEWIYIPLNSLMSGPDKFTFERGLEPLLKDIASRGNQTVMRVYLDYPRKPTGVPRFLIDQGLKLQKYTAHGGGLSPDYSDPRLYKALESFIAEFGKRYDGDPRLGFITIGLIGFWGEWHTYPHSDWFPTPENQNRVLRAYVKALRKTRLCVRKPTADSPKLPIGYHDDSFAFSTLPTVGWHFWSQMKAAKLTDAWQRQPIGGELRPECQPVIWSDDRRGVKCEDFQRCVQMTHCSWLINQHVFNKKLPDDQLQRAMAAARSLGYELHVKSLDFFGVRGERFGVSLTIENRGVAPFYYDWPIRLRLKAGKESGQWETTWKLTSIQPSVPKLLKSVHPLGGLKPGTYELSMKVVNPLAGGKPFMFANKEQAKDGWLHLGKVQVR